MARTTERARPRWGLEILLVLGVSLGQSAVYSLLRIIERLTRPEPLSAQTTQMNTSATPDRPWLDLAYQLANIAFPLVPVLLALYLLMLAAGPRAWPADDPGVRPWQRIGFDRTRLGSDLVRGFAVAAAIGIPGLGFYLLAREIGINTTVAPANLASNWWTVPVYVLAAAMNGILEEVLMLGYLFLRARQLQWSWTAVLLVSAVVRGSYHLYQGFGGFAGNLIMGIAFGLLFLRWKRVGPLVVAHTVLDVVAFVGYAVVAPRVDWL
ncbi:CPBP family intramembrane glutamic endopeptidase [Granulicoccus sp. GXG6511]|uniref:CPBP family intramembrane glutamic endopeptidase n=1 Tax=Granulicoccus sp. GXG6511 TaxID=3381351 RepID=UPI003D7DA09E